MSSTTRLIGEEEPYDTTHALGEEDVTSDMIGEEDLTTDSYGEEEVHTTDALGEEEPYDQPSSTVNPFGDF